MSDYEELKEKVAKEIHRYHWEINKRKVADVFMKPEDINALLDKQTDTILSLESGNLRIAVVEKESESPESYITEHWCEELNKLEPKIYSESNMEKWKNLKNWQDKYAWALTGYHMCERDKEKSGWVKEYKEVK